MKTNDAIDIRVRLQALWIMVMILMVFADIFTIMVELVYRNTLDGMPGEVRMVMAMAAVITLIPVSMIYLSRVLLRKPNRVLNIVAAILTILYVVGGGSPTPHYIVVGAAETAALIVIIIKSWKWSS